jgi:hypothetical protein
MWINICQRMFFFYWKFTMTQLIHRASSVKSMRDSKIKVKDYRHIATGATDNCQLCQGNLWAQALHSLQQIVRLYSQTVEWANVFCNCDPMRADPRTLKSFIHSLLHAWPNYVARLSLLRECVYSRNMFRTERLHLHSNTVTSHWCWAMYV